MTNKLFIGSLNYATTDSQLNDHFSKCGQVLSAKVIVDRITGQGKGFGFVEMATPEKAQEAINTLNNTDLNGRSIVVKEAIPQQSR
jgi:RNA recognition motif-containing protein